MPHSTPCHCPLHISPSPLRPLHPRSSVCARSCLACPGLCHRSRAWGVLAGGGWAGRCEAAGSPGEGWKASQHHPARCHHRDHPPICPGGQGTHSQGPSSITLLPGQSAGDTGLFACPLSLSFCRSPGAFSSPVTCVRVPATQLRNASPFALASAEVMFSAERSPACSGEGPRPEGPGDLATPLWPGSSSSLLAGASTARAARFGAGQGWM